MRYLTLLLMVSLCFSGCGTSQSDSDARDLLQYIDEIKTSGMSERAAMDISQVASLQIGQLSISYHEDAESGLYWPSLQSNTCDNPAMSPEEMRKTKERNREELKEAVSRLVRIADGDDSGFVSTEEAQWFRKIIEFRLQYEFVSNHLGNDWSSFGQNRDMSASDLEEWVAAYNKIAEKAMALGNKSMEPIELLSKGF